MDDTEMKNISCEWYQEYNSTQISKYQLECMNN